MKKNINLKIVIIFFIIGIVLILGLGTCFRMMLKEIQDLSINQSNTELMEYVNQQISQNNLIVIISIVIFTIISILIGYFVIKVVVSPMKKLIKSAEKIASGENVKMDDNIQKLGAVGDLENAFSLVTNELNQKLSEVNRQKSKLKLFCYT